MFPPATQPDILRAFQKDEYFVTSLREDLLDLFSNILGARSAHFESEVGLLSSLGYYAMTSLSGKRTLGEEYCDIMQVHGPARRMIFPSMKQRAGLVALQVVVPYIYKKSRKNARRIRLEDEQNGLLQIVGTLWNKFVIFVLWVGPFVNSAQQLHLGIFYLYGLYLQTSRRIMDIQYIYTRRPTGPRVQYQFLGLMMMFRLTVSALIWLKGRYTAMYAAENEIEESEEYSGQLAPDPDAPNCTLCLLPRTDTTVTDCGHMFCWKCICEWCTNKAECPLCRNDINLQRLIQLSHHV